MEPIIAKCGYRCDLCLVYEANFKLDPDKKKMCDAWTKYLGGSVKPEEIEICRGCQKGEGDPDCAVRKCAQQKNLVNCAHCDDFDCDNLKSKMDLVAKSVKDADNIPKEDYDRYIAPFLGRKHLLEIRKSLKNK
ncbi:MAG: DUF3795 domain-containing protein [Candidatus Hodarchaeota archaeon]